MHQADFLRLSHYGDAQITFFREFIPEYGRGNFAALPDGSLRFYDVREELLKKRHCTVVAETAKKQSATAEKP